MWVLTINSGSSSIKFSLFNLRGNSLNSVVKGIVEKIGEEKSFFRIKDGKSKIVTAKDHKEAMGIILNYLLGVDGKPIINPQQLIGIGHRVVHGGNSFRNPVIIDQKVIKAIEKFSSLAPLHNPPELLGIKACRELLPDIAQVAVFDTAFFQTIPDYAYIYAIPFEFYKRFGIRRYGFHGISHHYVAEETAKILKRPLNKLNLIICHLGNGCSISCIKNGKAIDTSMGFTPLEGLVMGTRSGDIDPAIIFYLAKKGISLEDLEEILNKRSGLLGISGISNDMREIVNQMKKKNKRAKLAYQIFVYRLIKYISSYLGVLGKCDAIVFTAGIGENQTSIKEDIKRQLKLLLNTLKTKVLIVPTDEELMIARQVVRLVR